MSDQTALTTASSLTPQQIESYRENGFLHVRSIISRDEATRFRLAAIDAAERLATSNADNIFTQTVNAWLGHEGIRKLTLHPNLAAVAQKLAGVPMRLWHDHILIKHPHNGRATEYHQDQPYWPHAHGANPISAWIALCDVPVERGCMSFINGSHRKLDVPMQHLTDPASLMTLCPDLVYFPRTTVPLRAGDCTFHHGRCAHMAGPNHTVDLRVAHVVIFMDQSTTYTGLRHPVTDPLGLAGGQPIEGELFPDVEDIVAGRARAPAVIGA